MMSAGQLLQSERLKRNKSLAEVASETCISKRYLEAIERDDIKELPGDFFYKAFLRQYAKSLDLDPVTTNKIVASAVPTEEVDPVPVLSGVYERAQESTSSSRWSPSTSVAVGALILVLAGGSGLYAWWQRIQTQREAAAEEAAARAHEPQPAVQTAPAQPPVPQAQTGTVTPAPSATNQTAAAQSAEATQPATPENTTPAQAAQTGLVGTPNIALELVATEPTWVQLSSGGKTLYIGVLQPADPKQFAVTDNARLLTGNAGGLDVRMNGRPVGSLGPRGQVRTVVFSNNSFQIAPPRPKGDTAGASAPVSTTASVSSRPTPVDH